MHSKRQRRISSPSQPKTKKRFSRTCRPDIRRSFSNRSPKNARVKVGKALVWDTSDQGSEGVSNALRFATLEEANAYARDLMGRWMAMLRYECVESTDIVRDAWVFKDGGNGYLARAIVAPYQAKTILSPYDWAKKKTVRMTAVDIAPCVLILKDARVLVTGKREAYHMEVI